MAHEVETMFYTSNEENGRFVPWHGLGKSVEHALTSAEAIEAAGLDWQVLSKPMFTEEGLLIPNHKANIRETDNSVLGIVTDRYQIVQNKDAFDFTDALIGEGVKYETAGSLFNGKKIFLLASLPETKIIDDEVVPYLCFTNSHDGFGAIQACCTNVRVVCNNTLNIALSGAKRKWSCKHVGNLENKLEEAKRALEFANEYNKEFAEFAMRAANTTLSQERQEQIISELFPVPEGATDRMKNNITATTQDFKNCLVAVDLSKFYGTAWGMINAASDFFYHRTPSRASSTYQDRKMEEAIVGSKFLDRVVELCNVPA